jgi:type I restriction enzyme S subunit
MEVRKGYKQTEVGIIPDEWEIMRIGEIGKKFLNGGTPSTKKAEFWIGTIPWITGADLIDQKISEVRRFITEEAIKNSSTNLIEKGNLLIATRTGVGKLAIAPYNVAISQDITGVYIDKEKVSVEYLFRYLDHHSNDLRSLNQGTSIEGITRDTLLSSVVLVPALAEQEAIAEALSDADALIEAIEQLLAKKRQIKQGAMSELLMGKRRLAGFDGKWEVKRLGEVLTLRYGKGQKDIIVNGGKFPIIATSGEVGRTNQYLYDKPSVIIGRKGTIDKPQYIDVPFWTIDTAYYSEISKQGNPKFLFYLLTTFDWYSYNEASGVPSLNAKTVENIEISLPALPEQTAIAEILSDMDAEISALEEKLSKARQVKAGMMSVLLTGKIRLV